MVSCGGGGGGGSGVAGLATGTTAAGTTDAGTTDAGTSGGATTGGDSGDSATTTSDTGYTASIPVATTDPSFLLKTNIPSPGPQTEIQITATKLDGSAAANLMILSVLTRKGLSSSATITKLSTTSSATEAVEVSVQRTFTDIAGAASIKFEGVQSGDQTETMAIVNNQRASAVVVDTIEFFLYSQNFLNGGSNDIGPMTLNGPTSLIIYRYKGMALLIVSDTSNARIMFYDLKAANPKLPVGTLGPKSFQNYTDDDPKCSATGMFRPEGIAADADRLYVADSGNGRLLVFNMDAVIAKIKTPSDTTQLAAQYVLGKSGFESDCFPTEPTVSATTLWQIRGLAIDTDRNLLFASQRGHNRISVFNVTSLSTNEDAVAVIGQSDLTSSAAGSGFNQLDSPKGLAFDASTNKLYVADSGNMRVLAFDTTSLSNDPTASRAFGVQTDSISWYSCDLRGAIEQVAVDGQGTLFVATAQVIAVFRNINTGTSSCPKIDNILGAPNLDGDWWPMTAPNDSSMGFAPFPFYDSTDKTLAVADGYRNRVLFFNLGSGLADGMAASDGWGHLDASGAFDFTAGASNTATGGENPSATNNPISSTFDPSGKRLFIADRGNNRITIYNTRDANGSAGASAPSGQPWSLVDRFADETLGYKNGTYNLVCPSFMAHSASDNLLYIRDWCNHLIVVYDTTHITQSAQVDQDWVYSFGMDPSREGMWFTGYDDRLMKRAGGLALDDDNKVMLVNNAASGTILCYNVSGIKTLISDWLREHSVFKTIDPTTVWSTTKTKSGGGWVNADIAFSRAAGHKKLFVTHRYDCADGGDTCNDVLAFNYGGSCASLGEPTVLPGKHTAGGHDAGSLFDDPSGLVTTADDRYLFVSDYGTIRIIDLKTSKQVNIIGTEGPGGIGSGADQFRGVSGLTLSPDDKFLYAIDQFNSRGKIFYRPLCQGNAPIKDNGTYSCEAQ